VFSHANEEAREVVLRQQLYSRGQNPASSTGSSQKKLTSPAKQSSSPRPATKKGSVTSRRDLNTPKPSWPTIDNVLSPFGLVSVDVGGNGDCQFLVLAHLFGNVDHIEVRPRVVAELTKHHERYFDFHESWRDVSGYNLFLHRMSTTGAWGGNATLMAAANAFKRKLNVVSDKFKGFNLPFNPETSTDGGDEIWLAYMDGNHYRATKPLPVFTTLRKFRN
jgi:hypothetical protein